MRNENKDIIQTEKSNTKHSREDKEIIGMKCKRILDYARIQYLCDNGFDASLKYYVKSDVTPENVSLIGVIANNKI